MNHNLCFFMKQVYLENYVVDVVDIVWCVVFCRKMNVARYLYSLNRVVCAMAQRFVDDTRRVGGDAFAWFFFYSSTLHFGCRFAVC